MNLIITRTQVCVRTKCVEVSFFISIDLFQIDVGPFGMFFFYISIKGVFMSEDEVEFVVLSTFVWPKHNAVRCPVMKLLLRDKRRIHHS